MFINCRVCIYRLGGEQLSLVFTQVQAGLHTALGVTSIGHKLPPISTCLVSAKELQLTVADVSPIINSCELVRSLTSHVTPRADLLGGS